jgi:hypothetical protein
MDGHDVDIWKWNSDRTSQQVNVYATIGASSLVGPGGHETHREEYFVGLLPPEDDVARSLALLAVEALSGLDIGHGHSVTFPEPLWPTTDMSSYLILRPGSVIIPELALDDGLHVEFLQAIPVHPSELRFSLDHGASQLLERWKELGVRFWDPSRLAD